jgi:hypothetical protein
VDRRNKKECPKSFRITGILGCELDSLNVLSLPALRAFGHVELHDLPFLQAAKAASLNGGEMHEDVFAILTADEAIAFGVVKPLYCSLFQLIFPFSFEFRLRRVAAGENGGRWLAEPVFNCG